MESLQIILAFSVCEEFIVELAWGEEDGYAATGLDGLCKGTDNHDDFLRCFKVRGYDCKGKGK